MGAAAVLGKGELKQAGWIDGSESRSAASEIRFTGLGMGRQGLGCDD